ncbi:ABC transporter ATP-binding protein [Pseudorhodoferax sp. Leaf274]|uniref:ABC transporter ATP-binding protein n=1 Tax=Pseudorhodoferax sp. Leaf274 TaxID=1736318 RepID=UPI00070262BC|nr:ATP-binding cassette domain-containing protein [Pseudorhodoferax sp. Leaf274]KQP35612.1 ABC transporter ATP-binding protein [Pseudorhodoferax sp. Leaf274]
MAAHIDVDLQLTVADGRRSFTLSAAFASDAAFVALYGPSGSGKSLTLQAMAGLLRPAAGHVRVAGRTLFDSAAGTNLPPAARRIGYLFQDYALFPHLSVRQNIAFGLTSWRHRRLTDAQQARIEALLQNFGLAAMAGSRPGTLSGGQRQRVALARALACEPNLLLLDEPFAALNPMLREELRAELAAACRAAAIPALMITHDVDDALALADEAFVYSEGRIVRRVDLRAGVEQVLQREALTGVCAPAATPLRLKLQRMLRGG